jgi:hypothetical protein
MDWNVGQRVRFLEQHRPPSVAPNVIGVIVGVESDTEPWVPRIRVRFDSYLSGWIWPHLLVRADG